MAFRAAVHGALMATIFRVVCVMAAVTFIIERNWAALCWVIVALLQHERIAQDKR